MGRGNEAPRTTGPPGGELSDHRHRCQRDQLPRRDPQTKKEEDKRHPRDVRWKETINRVIGVTSGESDVTKSIRKPKG